MLKNSMKCPIKFPIRSRDRAFWNKLCLLLALLLLPGTPSLAQHSGLRLPPPVKTPANARRGHELVADLLSRPPVQATNTGIIRFRAPDGNETRTRFRSEIYSTPTDWVSIYQTFPSPGAPTPAKLTIIHSDRAPNRYLLSHPGGGASAQKPQVLTANQTMRPFAGSDFWIADLGLQFLHWPQQFLVKKEMRRGQMCDKLESINPQPAPGAYSRVVSWIDIDSGGILHADAYDAQGRLVKEFDPTQLQKVNGQRELKEMEMRNHQTGSHSWIDFNPTP
jgi:YD repeat-containing protein